MKSIYESFDNAEWTTIQRAKNLVGGSWKKMILKGAELIIKSYPRRRIKV